MDVTTGCFMLSLALLFVLVFFGHFSIVISLGEERAGRCASCVFVYFTRVDFYPSSLPLDVALPGSFF